MKIVAICRAERDAKLLSESRFRVNHDTMEFTHFVYKKLIFGLCVVYEKILK